MRLRSLAPNGAIADPSNDGTHAHAERPAENFARAVDWYVAAMLAAQGRTNGFLTSVQDDALTGYGTVRPPDLTGQAGDALIRILDEIAPLYPEMRDSYLKLYGSSRPLGAADLLRSMVELELPEPAAASTTLQAAVNPSMAAAFTAIAETRERSLAAVDAWVCCAPGGARESFLEQARRTLVVEAAAARARRVALTQAYRLHGDAGSRWVARRLYGGPWPRQDIDEGMEELLSVLLADAQAVSIREVKKPALSFDLLAVADPCPVRSFGG
ncbi:hypothetical protein BH23GEM10_BH23GEM10_14750 [soil metagenome]